MKKALAVLLSLLMVVIMIPFSMRTANAEIASGQCGDDLNWTFNTATGVLKVTGTGKMWYYDEGSGDCMSSAWDDYKPLIKTADLPSGLTLIEDTAFSNCKRLTSVIIPSTVTRIGWYAFGNCPALTDVYYTGTAAQKAKITVGVENDPLLNATWHYVTKPAIVVQPKGQSVRIGKTASFSVTAAGKSLTYQWYYRSSSSADWKAVSADSGKTANYTLKVESRHNGYQYRCLVKNSKGSVYSNTVTLKAGTAPKIKTQPTDLNAAIGKTASFTVAATGTGLSYQWYFKAAGKTTWKAISAESGKTATYSLTAEARHDGYQYRCKVKNAFGYVYTDAVTLHTGNAPKVTTQPKNQSVELDKKATFKVVASGADLAYQWYYRTSSSGSWKASSASSAKTATYKVTAETKRNGYQYRCKISNAFGYVYSKAVTLTVIETYKDMTGEFRQTEARSIRGMINSFRTGDEAWYWNPDDETKTEYAPGTLNKLKIDYALEQIAMQRAAEIAYSFSHTRPSGQSWYTCTYEGVSSCGENIAWGYGSAESVFYGWREDEDMYAGQGHRRNMLNSSYNAVGIACFVYEGACCWVQEFGWSISDTAATPAFDGIKTVRIELTY